MANKIDTVERDRRLVHVYDNGMERDAGTGQIVKPPAGKLFTTESAKPARRRRQEKSGNVMPCGSHQDKTRQP